MAEPQPAAAPKRRWYRLTPGRLVLALLAVEALLWLLLLHSRESILARGHDQNSERWNDGGAGRAPPLVPNHS